MSSLSAGSLSPIDRARLSAELLQVRESLGSTTLSPIEQVRASARGLEIRKLLGVSELISEGQKAFDEAKAYYRENLQGRVVQSVIGPVVINGKGWNKTKFGLKDDPLKAKLIPHIEEILTSGKAGERTPTYKDRLDGMVAFYFIQKEVQVDHLMVLAGVQVGEDQGGNKYYNISHAEARNWKGRGGETLDDTKKGDDAQDYARVHQPRSKGIIDGLLDSLRIKPQLHSEAVEATVSDDDLNITILSVAPASSPDNQVLATGMVRQKNGGVLVTGDPAALSAYVAARLDGAKHSQTPEGIVFSKAQARLAEFIPDRGEKLSSGAVIYHHAALGGGASVVVGTEQSGVAHNLSSLKSSMAREWGPDKFRAVFGEDAAPEDIQAYQDEQRAIAQRKADAAAAEAEKASAPQRARELAATQAKEQADELARIRAIQEQERSAEFEKTVGIGKSGNPIYQAYLDTLEQLPTLEDGNSGFLGWAGLRAGEFERLGKGRPAANKDEYLAYVRDWADKHLADRVKASQEPPANPADPAKPVVEEPAAPAPAPQPEIIEYTTKSTGKVLRGIIRTDLTKDEAKLIDPHTWKMNGGYFIREKYLDADTAHIQAAPAPVVLSAEQQAEKQATTERQVEERRQRDLESQVQKLRTVANKAVATGDAGMNQDRNTNTARRAGMAASAIARAATDRAAGETLHSIADAIEVGTGGKLARLTSRAQLDQLQKAMNQAQYETDRGLSYREQLERRGRPFSDDDLKNVTFPRPMAWANRYKSAALTLAKKAPKGNSRLIAALSKIGSGPERFYLDPEKAAVTRKASAVLKSVGERWDMAYPMEALGAADRLIRMGITDTPTMQDAVRALQPHLATKIEEDPIKKAERALVGQKVGIDFFPTPAHVAQRMARKARISKGTRVLEPSAGNGNLADAAAAEGGEVDVIEISSQLRDILKAKGYDVVATNFNDFKSDEPYQAIVMNPPFSNRQDAEHIKKAYGMLAGGGTLVAIAGEGVFFGSDQKAVAFRDWLDKHGAEVEKLEGGTFKDNSLLAQTGVNARMITLTK